MQNKIFANKAAAVKHANELVTAEIAANGSGISRAVLQLDTFGKQFEVLPCHEANAKFDAGTGWALFERQGYRPACWPQQERRGQRFIRTKFRVSR